MVNSERDEILKVVHDFLHPLDHVSIGLVFGSVAHATFGPQSDLDLAVGGAHPLSPDEKVDIINGLSARLHREVDLIDLRTATGTVFKQALTTGVPILLKDPILLARFGSRMVFEEADFHSFRRKLMKERRKKVFNAK